MNVGQVMTKSPGICTIDDSLERAAQVMWDLDCGCVPVVDSTGRAVAMVTDRDVCMAAYTQGRRLDDVSVDTAMSRPARTCTAATTLEEAEDLMMAHAVRRLVVVDADGRVAGVVSIDDVARCGAAWDRWADIDLERAAMTLGEISRRMTATDEDGPEQPETDLTELVENSLAVLKTLRDEVRVDLNLAGKEVRDRWRRLETRLRAAETRAKLARRKDAGGLASLIESARALQRSLHEKPAKTPSSRSPARSD
jgi:CBS domain-containing protein